MYFNITPVGRTLVNQSSQSNALSTGLGFSALGITCSGLADAAAGRTAFALGTISTQDSDAVAITGGTISGVAVLPSLESKTADFTAATGFYYQVGTGAGNVIATLPAVAGVTAGAYMSFKIVAVGGANTLTIEGNGAETLDGAANKVLSNVDDFVTVRANADSSAWLLE